MINTDKYEGHTPAPWVWNDDWCSALIGLPNKEADIYDENAQTVISVNTDNTPICNSLYIDEHGVKHEAFPEEQLKNNALRSEDALLIADAPLLLEFIQKIVKDWCKPNQCNQAFGKDVRQLMYEYGLIIFDEETRRYEVRE